jgi:hypothetical protein
MLLDPSRILSNLEMLLRIFLWKGGGGGNNDKKLALISWGKLKKKNSWREDYKLEIPSFKIFL